jgi:ribonuclease HI
LKKALDIYIDGACRGNPGPAAIGVVVYARGQPGRALKEISRAIGGATNNIAEYTALVYGLQEALALKAEDIHIFTDSELLHRQMTGRYRIKNEKLKPLFDQARHMIATFKKFSIEHIPRSKNTKADALAGKEYKQGQK